MGMFAEEGKQEGLGGAKNRNLETNNDDVDNAHTQEDRINQRYGIERNKEAERGHRIVSFPLDEKGASHGTIRRMQIMSHRKVEFHQYLKKGMKDAGYAKAKGKIYMKTGVSLHAIEMFPKVRMLMTLRWMCRQF